MTDLVNKNVKALDSTLSSAHQWWIMESWIGRIQLWLTYLFWEPHELTYRRRVAKIRTSATRLVFRMELMFYLWLVFCTFATCGTGIIYTKDARCHQTWKTTMSVHLATGVDSRRFYRTCNLRRYQCSERPILRHTENYYQGLTRSNAKWHLVF